MDAAGGGGSFLTGALGQINNNADPFWDRPPGDGSDTHPVAAAFRSGDLVVFGLEDGRISMATT